MGKPLYKVHDKLWAKGTFTKGPVIVATVEPNYETQRVEYVVYATANNRVSPAIGLRPTIMREAELMPYNEIMRLLYE